jgi:sugar/nucleoside kinase (ribokinase family)
VPHVVCVGDLMVDVVAHLNGPLEPGSDTPAPIAFHGGGAAANVAAWLAADGCGATFVGRVGDDAAGREAVVRLSELGVDPVVSVDDARPTGCCMVLVDPAGERTMIPSVGANSGLGAGDPFATLPARADALYLSGYALLDPGSRPFALGALALARQRNWLIAVDAASAAPLRRVGPADFLGWLPAGVVLLANDDEARVLVGEAGAAGAARLAAHVGAAVVKSGAAGASFHDANGSVRAPASPVRVYDTIGAGDAFAAGFLRARLTGGEPVDWLGSGLRLAAQAVGVDGGRPPILRRP